ncbi:unnamed protein product, partial [Adineta steineri]
MKFTDLKEQINQFSVENQFNDIDVIHFRNKLSELIEESKNPEMEPVPATGR